MDTPLPLCDWNIHDDDGSAMPHSDIVAHHVLRLLQRRGLADIEDERAVTAFLDSPLASLSHPFTFPGVERASRMILETISAGGQIVIFGDFDCDGIVATALLTALLRLIGADVVPFIPTRSEGYGLTDAAVERCLAETESAHSATMPRLLITVDCGMGACAALKRFIDAGYRIIVTDHHTPGDPLPSECVEIRPSLERVPDSCRHLCGAGVAYKLACGAITMRHPLPDRTGRAELHEWMGPLAIATVADVVPLLGENRAYVREGLNVLNRRPGIGIKALIREAFKSTPTVITAYHIGFVLGPHINAAGRMESAEPALKLLLSDTDDVATPFAKELKRLNAARQHDERELLDQIEKMLEDRQIFDPERDGAAVIAGDNWHPGVIGLAAGRLCSRLKRPIAVISCEEGGEARGSVRAPAVAYNVWNALNDCSSHLIRFGGHESAAGFSLMASEIPNFRRSFAEACRAQAGAVMLRSPLEIEGTLGADDISVELSDSIRRLEPCGNGNETPVWAILGAKIKPFAIGADKQHLRLKITRDDDGLELDGIWFGAARFLSLLESVDKWDLAGEIAQNEFRGDVTIQFVLRDARPSRTYCDES